VPALADTLTLDLWRAISPPIGWQHWKGERWSWELLGLAGRLAAKMGPVAQW